MIIIPESHRDLLKSDIAILATIGSDGFPQVTALWFLFDNDGMVRLSLNTKRQKVKNLRSHSECSLFIIDRANPSRTLEIRARAEINQDSDYKFADKLGNKYGADIRKIDKVGESRIVVTIIPVSIHVHDSSK
jgi:PPOX class probable F420-dependent enzyme